MRINDDAQGAGCCMSRRALESIHGEERAERQRKEAATLTARAALLGLELQPVADGRWRLSAYRKATEYASLQAAAGVVFGVELVRRDLAAMLGNMGSRHA